MKAMTGAGSVPAAAGRCPAPRQMPAPCLPAQPARTCSSSASQQRQRLVAHAQVQEAMTIAPVYASAWVSKARQDKSLRRAYQDVKALKAALLSEADPEGAAPSNGASPDTELENEVNESYLGSLSSLQLDEAGQGEREVEDYQVGKLAYGDESDTQAVAAPDVDPADIPDEGSRSTGLQAMLSDPTLPLRFKMQVLTVLQKELGLKRMTLNFLQLLIAEARVDTLAAILDSFETLYNQAINLQVASVRSASPLDEEDQYAIAKIVQGRTGKRHVRVNVQIDDSLLAGFIVEFNYEMLDFSVKAAIRDAVERTAGALGVAAPA